jgi:hypothetical protein
MHYAMCNITRRMYKPGWISLAEISISGNDR